MKHSIYQIKTYRSLNNRLAEANERMSKQEGTSLDMSLADKKKIGKTENSFKDLRDTIK